MLKSSVMSEYRGISKKNWTSGENAVTQRVNEMEKTISSVIQHSGHGWETVIEPLVIFGLVLTDTSGLKGGEYG